MSFERFFDNTKEIPENPLLKLEEEQENEDLEEENKTSEGEQETGAEENKTETKETETKNNETETKDEESKEQDNDEKGKSEIEEKIANVLKKFGFDPENVNESEKKLAKSYSEVERKLTQNFQELAESKRKIEELTNKVEQMAQLVEGLNNQKDEEGNELSEEDKEKQKEELLDLLYEDPQAFIDKMYEMDLSKRIEKKLKEFEETIKNTGNKETKEDVTQKAETSTEQNAEIQFMNWANEFIKETGLTQKEIQEISPEINDYLNKNQSVINEAFEKGKNPYITAYEAIKASKETKTEETKTKETNIKETNAKTEKEIEIDEETKQKIIQEYLQSLEKNRPPATITKKGGPPPVSPPNKPKTIKEASSMFRKLLGS